MIKGSIHQEDITIINIYVPNIGAPKYFKQILTDLKGEVDDRKVDKENVVCIQWNITQPYKGWKSCLL